MPASPTRRSSRGLPTWVAKCSRSRLPTLASSSPTKPRNGARWSGRPTSRRSDPRDHPGEIFHNVPFGECRMPVRADEAIE